MAINLAKIANALRPGVREWYGMQPTYNAEYKQIYNTFSSKMAYETDVEYKPTGLAQIRPEGQPTFVSDISQRTVTTYTHKTIGLQVVFTRQALINNLYKSQFPHTMQELRDSINTTEETLAVNPLNAGFTTYTISDGQTFFSTAHPIDGGTVANRPAVGTDLTEGTLEAAIIAISKFKDPAGNLRQYKPKRLIVPTELDYTATRLLQSQYRAETNTNAINAIYHSSSIPEGHKVNHYLTSASAWFILTDATAGMKHFVREPFETDVYADFDTQNIKMSAIKTLSFGVSNWRAMYGNPGA